MDESDKPQGGEEDLSALLLNETGTLLVRNKYGTGPALWNGKQIEIELFGASSQEYIEAQRRSADILSQVAIEIRRGRRQKASELAEKAALEKLVACTKQLRNAPPDWTPRSIYSDPHLNYITKQVVAYQEDDANF